MPSQKASQSFNTHSLPPSSSGEYLPIGVHAKVELVVPGAKLADLNKLVQLLSNMPLAIPSQTPVRLSLLPGTKLLIDFLGGDVEFQAIEDGTECRILNVRTQSESTSLQIALGKVEYSVELKKGEKTKIVGDNEPYHTWQRTSYPFRSPEKDSDRNSESRGGCGGGER